MNEPVLSPERAVTSRAIFCAHCVAETSDQTPGNVSTLNGIGRKFYGGAQPCPECASVIRTLWWCVVDLPILPLGSYRYKTAREGVMREQYWCRQLSKRYWPQIWKTWRLGLVSAVLVAVGVVLYEKYKGGFGLK